jgi:phosphohistidine phosphatase
MSEISGSELILWRHAEAEDPVPGKISDPQRALTPRGMEQAARMAAWLNARLKQCRILASPATRTCQTADALKRAYEMDPRVGLRATPQTLLAAAGWPGASGLAPSASGLATNASGLLTNASGVTIVVGHQPTLGETAALLLPGLDMDWNLQRGAIVWIAQRGMGATDTKAGSGKAQAVLRVAMTPEAIGTA